jgi:hypothetical protein
VDETDDAPVPGDRLECLPVSGQLQAGTGELPSHQVLGVGSGVGEHGGCRVGEDDRPLGELEDLPESDLADVHQVDHDPEPVQALHHLPAQRRQATLPVRRPTAVGEEVAPCVCEARGPESQRVVEIEEAWVRSQGVAPLEREHQGDLAVFLGPADVADRGGEHQIIVPCDLVVEVPHHLHAAPEGIPEPVVVEVDRAQLSGDSPLPPAGQVVLPHAAEPGGVGTHAELHDRVALEAWRPLPVEPWDLDPLAQRHLALGHRDQDVTVAVDDDGAVV